MWEGGLGNYEVCYNSLRVSLFENDPVCFVCNILRAVGVGSFWHGNQGLGLYEVDQGYAQNSRE